MTYTIKEASDITGIWLSWPFGWVISSTLSLAFYLFGVWNPLKKKA